MIETIFSLDGEETTPGTEEGGNGTQEGGEMPSSEPQSRLNDGEEEGGDKTDASE